MWQAAVDIFAFDALIQNPDRRYHNPNLLTKGESLFVYDHELAFSFLDDVLPSTRSWSMASQRWLREHVLYRRLKSQPIDLTGFSQALDGLSDGMLGTMVADIPVEWNNGIVAGIERHLRVMREHSSEFAEEIRRFLV